MNKVNVIGTTGSGKSTFGKALAKAIDGEYIEMDALFWKPNWQNADDEEFFSAVEQALSASPRCVIDGNYSRTTALKWQYCDTVIWLDYSYARSLYQITRRSLARAMDKRELWAGTGNRELGPVNTIELSAAGSYFFAWLGRGSVVWFAK